MKLRIIDRILIALSGLILLAQAVWIALDLTGLVIPVSEALAWLFNAAQWRKVVLAACAVLALLGIYGISVLFRRKKGKRSFIAQRSENGEIQISVKSIESLVYKCAQKHGEVKVQTVTVEEARDGLVIKLRAALANGMNIPLAVGTLQKQIKQYVTACSGVDVSEVRVKVESTDRSAEDSPYAVPDGPAALPVEEPEPAPTPAEATALVELPEEEAVVEEPAEEDRPVHQRMFSAEEEPNMVPEPPVEIPSEEEIQAEAEQAAAAVIEEAIEPNTAWVEQNEPQWDAKAAVVEAEEAYWTSPEQPDPEEPAETDGEGTTEE